MDLKKSDTEAKINLILISHVEKSRAKDKDRWTRVAEGINKSIKDHELDGAEEFSAKMAELRYKDLVHAAKADIYAETIWKLIFYHEETPLNDVDRWSKIAQRINNYIRDKGLDSSEELTAEEAESRYEGFMQVIEAETEDENDSQETETDPEDEKDSRVTDAETNDENDSQATEADTDDAHDGSPSEADTEDQNDRQWTKSEMEDEVDWKLCATNMHQRWNFGYENPNWTELATTVNDFIKEMGFHDVDLLTAETAKARYDDLEANDNVHFLCYKNVKRM